MDSPSFQSSSKCGGSDFSIKRILGDIRSSEEECPDSPSWLCCTRYQPPRLPRSNASSSRSRRSGRHARVPFTGAQAAALEAAYSRAHYLAPPALRALAAALQLRDDRIKIWFQNRRARERREKNGNVTPPKPVTLQTTAGSRLPTPREISPFWNGFNYTVCDSNTNRLTNINNVSHTIVSSDVTTLSGSMYQTSSPKQPFAKISEDLLNYDDNRCESPLDIETVDS